MRSELSRKLLDLPLMILGAPIMLAGWSLYFCLNLKAKAQIRAAEKVLASGEISETRLALQVR
jgi:hypothetical protein